MEHIDQLIEGSAREHGHLCAGQIIGVRMAVLGCKNIGLLEPRTLPEIKKLIVYVEIDRCATDAIAYATGMKLGRRSLKFVDNGIMAATFVNLETNQAVRIVSTEESRDLADRCFPEIKDRRRRQLEAYKAMPDDELFTVERVRVAVPAHDMPGPTRFKCVCEQCGATIRDKREVFMGGRILCRPCAYGTYYQPVRPRSSMGPMIDRNQNHIRMEADHELPKEL